MRLLLVIVYLNLHGFAQAQNHARYPNETEVKAFVQWLTEVYWDSFELDHTLDSNMGFPLKSWFLVDSGDRLSMLYTGQLRSYFDTADIQYFFAQIDSFEQEDFVPDSLNSKYFNLAALEAMSEGELVGQLLDYKKVIFSLNPHKIIYTYKWNHDFLSKRMTLTDHSYEGSPFYFKTSNWISYPIFNREKTKVIVDVTMFCGPLCAWGTTFVFEKTTDGWKAIIRANVWVS